MNNTELCSDPYVVPRSRDDMDLILDGSASTPTRTCGRVLLDGLGPNELARYPDVAELEALIAEECGRSASSILLTAGADGALERLTRLAVEAGGRAIVFPPTFEMIERYLGELRAEVVAVPWQQSAFPVDEAIRSAREGDTLFLVSPNNPTGAVLTASDLRSISEALPTCTLVLDLVYGDFADEDLEPVAREMSNVLVVRSLSKSWGLAGLRVGWASGAPERIAALRSRGAPFPVAGPSLRIARSAFRTSGGVARQVNIDRVRRERDALQAVLSELGLDVAPSQANFVLARGEDADRLWDDLGAVGIAVRRFVSRAGLEDALRISCPCDDAAFDRLVRAVRSSRAPEAILFDMDGVLVDVSDSYRAAIIATAESFGVSVSGEAIADAKAAGNANDDWALTQRLMFDAGLGVPLDQVRDRFEKLYQGDRDTPGLRRFERPLVSRSTLKALSARLPLGVVTGRPRADAQRFLADSGLGDCFDAVICREDAPLKPSPDPILLALERLGVRGGWMIGDTVDDIRAARAAGVLPFGVVAPGDDGDSLRAAARVLPDVAALLEVLS